MIRIGDTTISLSDPASLAALAALAVGLLLVILLVMTVRRAGAAARLAEPMLTQVSALGERVRAISDGQQQLAGGLTHVSEAQTQAQAEEVCDRLCAVVSDRLSLSH